MSRQMPKLLRSASKRMRRASSVLSPRRSTSRGSLSELLVDEEAGGAAAAAAPPPTPTDGRIPTDPEEYFALLADKPVPAGCEGCTFGFRIKESEWVLSCKGDRTSLSKRPATGKKDHGCTAMCVYKNNEIFAKAASIKGYDMIAYVMGKIKIYGSMKKLELMEPVLPKISSSGGTAAGGGTFPAGGAEQRPSGPLGASESSNPMSPTYAGDASFSFVADELKVEEPTDVLSSKFWERHLGNDALFGAWMWTYGAACLLGYYSLVWAHATNIDDEVMGACYVGAAVMWTVGSLWFVMLSYPEKMAQMYMEIASMDTTKLTFVERYFTANEMLVATWFFALSAVFYYIYAFFLVAQDPTALDGYKALVYAVIVTVVLLMFSWTVMPDTMKMNNNQGSRVILDSCFTRCCCMCALCCRDSVKEFGERHLFSDFLAVLWFFFVVSLLATVYYIYLVSVDPTSTEDWLLLQCQIGFAIGSAAMANTMYPGYLKSRVYFDVLTCYVCKDEEVDVDFEDEDIDPTEEVTTPLMDA